VSRLVIPDAGFYAFLIVAGIIATVAIVLLLAL
jgi:hypothetical protein